MDRLVDIQGSEVHEGDVVAYAMRVGDRATLATYRIVGIGERVQRYKYYYEREVVAEQLTDSGKPSRNTKQSRLQGELFPSRAIIISRKE
jgi:hypothetical protein